ncbi:MAG TPA: bifunctional oligoribonuclease/PAP phosphatase NrnA [Candidatus Tectomicrobia bacterium]|nr:bifunctional oligoribonuclease/PAP phosphatase NrnA [Candidatus Tectomicrobia bacterium]
MTSLQLAARRLDPELRAITRWLQRRGSDHFLVTSHVHPDGDGLASMLACGHILRSLGKQVWLVADGSLAPRYAYLPQIDTIAFYREGLESELPVANVITVDVPTLSRLERVGRLIPSDASILKIDHHPGDDHFGRFNYVDPQASSTAELIYPLCVSLGIPLDASLGTWIYTGIAFDTGRFRFSSTTPNALIVAGEMVRAGANPQLIAEQLFYEYRPATLALLTCTLQSLEYFLDGRVTVLSLDHAVLGQARYRDADTEGFVDYAVSVQGAEVALFLREHEPGQIRISLRAKHDFDVRAVAELFGGGGHRKAAGARMTGTIQQAKARLLAEIQRHLEASSARQA